MFFMYSAGSSSFCKWLIFKFHFHFLVNCQTMVNISSRWCVCCDFEAGSKAALFTHKAKCQRRPLPHVEPLSDTPQVGSLWRIMKFRKQWCDFISAGFASACWRRVFFSYPTQVGKKRTGLRDAWANTPTPEAKYTDRENECRPKVYLITGAGAVI